MRVTRSYSNWLLAFHQAKRTETKVRGWGTGWGVVWVRSGDTNLSPRPKSLGESSGVPHLIFYPILAAILGRLAALAAWAIPWRLDQKYPKPTCRVNQIALVQKNTPRRVSMAIQFCSMLVGEFYMCRRRIHFILYLPWLLSCYLIPSPNFHVSMEYW